VIFLEEFQTSKLSRNSLNIVFPLRSKDCGGPHEGYAHEGLPIDKVTAVSFSG
jgi:hypothetical protein